MRAQGGGLLRGQGGVLICELYRLDWLGFKMAYAFSPRSSPSSRGGGGVSPASDLTEAGDAGQRVGLGWSSVGFSRSDSIPAH